jgi:hypothetical protein
VAKFAFGSAVSALLDEAAPPSRAQRPRMEAWQSCAIAEAKRIDDGKTEVGTIADALTTSCGAEWHAAKLEGCEVGRLNPMACSLFSEKMDANLRSQDIKVVLAVRAAKAETSR